jgi:hypothetical protein
MCDVMLVTWTLKTTWKYKCPYNNYAFQKVLEDIKPLRNYTVTR